MNASTETTTDQAVPTKHEVTHQEAVTHLLRRLETLCDGDPRSPRIVLLRGPSGIGKTWTIREFYNRLRDVNSDKYWPKLQEQHSEFDTSINPLAERKKIIPDLESFVWESGALPTFGWWGFNCERLASGGAQSTLAEAFKQFSIHFIPLQESWRKSTGLSPKLAQYGQKAINICRDVLREEGPTALLSSAGIEVPILSTLIEQTWKAAQSVQKKAKIKQDLRNTVGMGERHVLGVREQSEKLSAELSELATARLPSIIAIEDIQLMGTELSMLMDSITGAKFDESPAGTNHKTKLAPVLVVGTVWAESFNNADSEFTRWATQAQQQGRLEILDLRNLGEEELIGIVNTYAKKTKLEVSSRIVQEPLNNPFFLKLWLTSRYVRRHLRRNSDEQLKAEMLQELPDSAQAVLKQRWNELPPTVQEALLCAVAINPLGKDERHGFVPKVVANVLTELGADYWRKWDTGQAEAAIREAAGLVGWCRSDGEVQSFTESSLEDIVRQQVDLERFSDEDKAHIQVVTLDHLAKWLQDKNVLSARSSSTQSTAYWYATLRQEIGHDSPYGRLAPETLVQVGHVLANGDNYDAAVKLVQPSLSEIAEHFGARSREFVELRWSFAQWTGSSGEYEHGTRLLAEALNDAAAWFPEEASAAREKEASHSSISSEGGMFSEMDFHYHSSGWETAHEHESTLNELSRLEQNPLKGHSQAQHMLDLLTAKMDFIEFDSLGQCTLCRHQEIEPIQVAEEILSEITSMALGPANPLLQRVREHLAQHYTWKVSQVESGRESWGSDELIDPRTDPAADSEDDSDEAYWQALGAADRLSTYEFLSEHEQNLDYYRSKALEHYRALLTVAQNMEENSGEIKRLTDEIRSLERDQSQKV